MKNNTWKYIIIAFLPIQIGLFTFLSNQPNLIENSYIQGVFKYLTQFLRILTGKIPFSVGLIFIYFLGFFGVIKLFISLKKAFQKKLSWRVLFTNLAVIISVLYGIYMLTWGLAYDRKPIAEIRNLNTQNISDAELENLCDTLIILTNNARKELTDKEVRSSEITNYFKTAPLGYAKIAETNSVFIYQYPSIKLGFTKDIMSYLNSGGVYSFWSGEANVNENEPNFKAPFTICHEMAHQLGFASEEEANYVSYLACINNVDPMFHYSTYYSIMHYALRAIWRKDKGKYNSLKTKLSRQVLDDEAFEYAIWEKYKNPLEKYTTKFYDLFLKSNGQESGIQSYGLVVELMIGEFRKNKKI